MPLYERICVHLIPHDFQWLTPDFLTLSREAEETGATALDLGDLKALLENISLRVLASRKDVVGHAQ